MAGVIDRFVMKYWTSSSVILRPLQGRLALIVIVQRLYGYHRGGRSAASHSVGSGQGFMYGVLVVSGQCCREEVRRWRVDVVWRHPSGGAVVAEEVIWDGCVGVVGVVGVVFSCWTEAVSAPVRIDVHRTSTSDVRFFAGIMQVLRSLSPVREKDIQIPVKKELYYVVASCILSQLCSAPVNHSGNCPFWFRVADLCIEEFQPQYLFCVVRSLLIHVTEERHFFRSNSSRSSLSDGPVGDEARSFSRLRELLNLPQNHKISDGRERGKKLKNNEELLRSFNTADRSTGWIRYLGDQIPILLKKNIRSFPKAMRSCHTEEENENNQRKAWRPGVGQRMTSNEKDEAKKTSSQLSEKNYRSDRFFEVLESFVGRKKRIVIMDPVMAIQNPHPATLNLRKKISVSVVTCDEVTLSIDLSTLRVLLSKIPANLNVKYSFSKVQRWRTLQDVMTLMMVSAVPSSPFFLWCETSIHAVVNIPLPPGLPHWAQLEAYAVREYAKFVYKRCGCLLPIPEGKLRFGTKWILKNNKRWPKGIDYDERFLLQWLELMKLFRYILSHLLHTCDFMAISICRWQSAFLLWVIDEKSLLLNPKDVEGLQVTQKSNNGIFISQDKYVQDMLKKFDMVNVRSATTPFEATNPKSKEEPDEAVNVHLYRSMIGSLMYLTASRPDIQFAVSACSRHQVTPLTSHLNAVKRIFKYLKGRPKLGLWYPRDSPFVLEAYSDSDYAGSHGDRKSTTGGCQFLGRRLISWQCKKQTIVATSSTEAEYVAAANCCGQSTICIVKNPVFHQRTKHIEIRHHFIRDANEKHLIQVLKIHTDDNMADLLTKAFDGPREMIHDVCIAWSVWP
ncbi:hypothetical protein Tco_0285156 [Tanacetum coccineum]